jgi:hypothetical protein
MPKWSALHPRSRRRRTLHPDQRTLPLGELADADAIYGSSFVLTNLDVSTPDKAAAVEHWYRHRTRIEDLFRDSKHGAALRHLRSLYRDRTGQVSVGRRGSHLGRWGRVTHVRVSPRQKP